MAINEKQLKRLNVQDEPMVVYCAREQLKKGIRYGPVIREVFIIECNISGHGAVVINAMFCSPEIPSPIFLTMRIPEAVFTALYTV